MSGPQTLPERVARTEGRVEEHSRALEDIAGRFTNVERRLDRFEADVHARFERLEGRFDRFEGRLDRLDDKIDGARSELDAKLTRQFTWTVGLIGGSALGLAYEILRVASAR